MATPLKNPFGLQPVQGFKPGPEQALSAANVAQALGGGVPLPQAPLGQTLNPAPQPILPIQAQPQPQPQVPLSTGLGNVRTPTNMPRPAALQDIQAALAQQQPAQAPQQALSQPAVPLGPPAPMAQPQAQEAAQALSLNQVQPSAPIQAPGLQRVEQPFPQPQVAQAPTGEIPMAQAPTGLEKFGAKLSEGLANPKVQQAMFQAAQALDPTGFGGRLATSGLENLAGQESGNAISGMLAGKSPEEVQSILSQPEMSQAIADVQKIEGTKLEEEKVGKIESPAQKLLRSVTTASIQGDKNMAVAQTRILGDMAKNVATIQDKNMRQEVGQAYNAISEIRKTIPVDILSADGTINEQAFLEAVTAGQPIMTDAQKESLKSSVDLLEKQGFDTLGMRAYLDRTESLTKKPAVATNPLSPVKEEAPALNIADQVRAGNLQDNGDGTFTILKHENSALINQKVRVDANGKLRTI